jgi:hypothetical protein
VGIENQLSSRHKTAHYAVMAEALKASAIFHWQGVKPTG